MRFCACFAHNKAIQKKESFLFVQIVLKENACKPLVCLSSVLQLMSEMADAMEEHSGVLDEAGDAELPSVHDR